MSAKKIAPKKFKLLETHARDLITIARALDLEAVVIVGNQKIAADKKSLILANSWDAFNAAETSQGFVTAIEDERKRTSAVFNFEDMKSTSNFFTNGG